MSRPDEQKNGFFCSRGRDTVSTPCREGAQLSNDRVHLVTESVGVQMRLDAGLCLHVFVDRLRSRLVKLGTSGIGSSQRSREGGIGNEGWLSSLAPTSATQVAG